MILQNPLACDACKTVIDKTKGYIEYLPQRGGLQLNVYNAENNAGVLLNKPMHFCDDDCHATYVGTIRKSIKPLPPVPNKPIVPGNTPVPAPVPQPPVPAPATSNK
jgi:hypothetical protein